MRRPLNQEVIMFCSKCGKELKEDASFCTSCGAPKRAAEGKQAPPEGVSPPPQAGAPPQPPPAAPPPGAPPPQGAPEVHPGESIGAPKRRMSVPVVVAIAVVACMLLAAVIVVPMVLVSKSSQNKAHMRTCQANQRTIDGAIMVYAAESPDESYPSSLEDMVAPDTQVLKSIPTCPSGDKPYIWVEGEIGKPPTVSCPNSADHAP